MALKNLFDMVKADRYTQDGREAIIKAQEAETEDKVYQIGEISQKTGLQKTANGWVKPKSGKQPGAKKQEKKGAGIPQATTETFVGKTYKDFVESATPSGYKPTKNTDNPDGSSTTVFEKEGKQLKVDFDKSGKIIKVTPGESKPAAGSQPATEKVASTQEFIKIPTARGYAKVPKEAYSKYANNKTNVRLSDYIGRKMAGKPSSESNKFYDFVQKKIYESGEDPKPYLGQGGYSYPQRLIDMYYDEWKSKTTDSAPRALTGDTRIRVRKA